MNIGELIATLGVDSSQLRKAEQDLRGFEQRASSGFSGIKSDMSSMIASAAKVAVAITGISLSIDGVVKAIRFGIQAMEEFRLATIQIGSGLTNVAKEGQGAYADMFYRNYQYAQQMYEEIRKEDAKRFASASDLMTSYNALVQKGYAVRLDEIDALGVLTDRIKLATAGQNTQMQINQEIRALMDGQARAGSLLANELKDRLGPEWENIVAQHRQAGTLLKYLASLWPGISAACKEVENTLEAQTTTLQGNLKAIGREGMAGVYADIVGLLQTINDWLREHEKIIANDIYKAWVGVKEIAQGVYGVLSEIYDILRQMTSVTWRLYITPVIGAIEGAAKWLAQGETIQKLAGVGSGGGMTTYTAPEMSPKEKMHWNQIAADKAAAYKRETYQMYLKSLGQTTPKPRRPEEKGGGKGLESAQRQIENFIQTMQQVTAKASGDSYAALDEWYNKQALVLKRLEDQVGYSKEAHVALEQAKYEQLKKLDRDYYDWYARETGDKVQGVITQTNDLLDKYGNVDEKRRQIQEIGLRKIKEIELERQSTILTAQQQTLQAMAAATPYLSQQLDLQSQILAKENEMATLEIRRKELKGEITSAQAAELLGLQALTNQAKLYAYERSKWETQGVYGGLKIAGVNAENTALTYTAKATASYLEGLPQEIGSGIANWMVATMKGEKHSFEDLGYSMAAKFIETTMTGFANQIMPYVIKGLGSLFGGLFGPDFSGGSATGGFLGFHEGGIIRAHRGWPLRSDEVPIIAQTGERVLSRRQNAAFEAGMFAQPSVNVIINNNSSNTQASAEQSPEGDIIVTIDDLTSKAYARRGSLFKLINSSSMTRR